MKKIASVKSEPHIRVLLSKNIKAVEIVSETPAGKKRIVFTMSGGQLVRDGASLGDVKAYVAAPKGGTLKVGEFICPGGISIVIDNSMMAVLNELPLETYLAGVLPSEMPMKFPKEALRAQVIAARTYAIGRMVLDPEHRVYDVVATTSDQVFKGAEAIDPAVREIVASTRGTVMTYDGEIFLAYFHSTCGGHTVRAMTALPKATEDIPPLAGVECGYCKESPRYTWETEISAADFAKLKDLPAGATVKEIRAGELTAEGRLKNVILATSEGEVTVDAFSFRETLGNARIFSTWITSIEKTSDGFVFKGRGFGHGAGMCQFGASGLAGAGKTAADILKFFYYPGVELLKLY
jgi:stage II sporulation protein D